MAHPNAPLAQLVTFLKATLARKISAPAWMAHRRSEQHAVQTAHPRVSHACPVTLRWVIFARKTSALALMAQLQRELIAGQQAHQNAPRVILATTEWPIIARLTNVFAMTARRRREQIASQLAITNALHAAVALKILVTLAHTAMVTRVGRARGGIATLGVVPLATSTPTSASALLALATSKECALPFRIVISSLVRSRLRHVNLDCLIRMEIACVL